MSKFSLALACAVLAFGALSAQEAISHNSLFAVGDLSGKWTYRAETHFVRGDFMKQSRQLILRPAFIYKLSKSIRLSGGLSYLYNASYEGGLLTLTKKLTSGSRLIFHIKWVPFAFRTGCVTSNGIEKVGIPKGSAFAVVQTPFSLKSTTLPLIW